MPESPITARFYTLDEVATILNVRPAQVYAMVRSGELPAIKLGGRGVWRVDRQRLEDYLQAQHQRTAEWARAHPLSGDQASD
jgi:excisionase family DNA binding protein